MTGRMRYGSLSGCRHAGPHVTSLAPHGAVRARRRPVADRAQRQRRVAPVRHAPRPRARGRVDGGKGGRGRSGIPRGWRSRRRRSGNRDRQRNRRHRKALPSRRGSVGRARLGGGQPQPQQPGAGQDGGGGDARQRRYGPQALSLPGRGFVRHRNLRKTKKPRAAPVATDANPAAETRSSPVGASLADGSMPQTALSTPPAPASGAAPAASARSRGARPASRRTRAGIAAPPSLP